NAFLMPIVSSCVIGAVIGVTVIISSLIGILSIRVTSTTCSSMPSAPSTVTLYCPIANLRNLF
ncbi:MAG: hypothetical protein RSC96_07425, partial [Oscillospiraceae bacterium]